MSAGEEALWPYYALDFPGLSKADAERILEWVKKQGPALDSLISGRGLTPGSIVEPEHFYTRHIDAWSVRLHLRAIQIALASGELSEDEATGLRSASEDFTEWLEQAVDDPDDEDGADRSPVV
ncbi:hypothetical protein [Blastococcus xanthinilyticus]|uniref:Uncharacterized protein n=1 Tax=Blastococcus xanthinilyticus TaxID=1564164 RepID=A0A5S5D3I7_9ACTN|nr:hypothetical protein [Blastococcus xanthinilyticus]TYP90593.1 hypothetical protein BD833_101311 [Blastococcus xanthinilyticus]